MKKISLLFLLLLFSKCFAIDYSLEKRLNEFRRIGFNAGTSFENNDIFLYLYLHGSIETGHLGGSVSIPIRFLLFDKDDDSSFDELSIPKEDWDGFRDIIKVIDYFHYGNKLLNVRMNLSFGRLYV